MSFLTECQKKIADLQWRVRETSRNVISRTQKWRRKSTVVPTSCDVVLVFTRSAPELHVQWFISVLQDRVPELHVVRQFHRTSGQFALYLTACYRDLLIGAEELCLKKSLAEEYGGGLREFSMEELDLFANATDEVSFFTSSERAYIVHHYLMGLCANEGDKWDDLAFTEGQLMIHSLQSCGLIDQIFPVHEPTELKLLTQDWIQGWKLSQPLDDIRRYFGVQIALYFSWLGHYTAALLVPACVGLFVWFFMDSKEYKFYHIFMALLTLFWAAFYLEHWKRTNAVLTYQWGMLDAQPTLLEEARAAFKGKLAPCPITGRMVRTYPSWRRKVIYFFFTWPVVCLSLLIIVLITLGFVSLQDYVVDNISMDESSSLFENKFNALIVLLPKVLLSLVIFFMDIGYRRLSVWLTTRENHRLDTEYHHHLMGKLIPLQFMNSFFPLFYTAFYLQDMEMLRQQLSTQLIFKQIFGNLREIFLPYGQSRIRQFLLSMQYERYKLAIAPATPSRKVTPNETVEALIIDSAPNGDSLVRQRIQSTSHDPSHVEQLVEEQGISAQEREATLLPFDGPDEDFAEMFIQFGYVCMFSSFFPIAGVLALLNNVVEIRGDAFKLITSYQRSFASPNNNMRVWDSAMRFMGYLAVIVNVGLLHVSGTIRDLFPQLNTNQSIILLIVAEHILFLLNYTVSALISDTPVAVMEQIAKLEYRRREALRTVEREIMRGQHRTASHSEDKSDEESESPSVSVSAEE